LSEVHFPDVECPLLPTGHIRRNQTTSRESEGAALLRLERDLTEASLAEALRLLGSPRFEELTESHVREDLKRLRASICGSAVGWGKPSSG
jgi:hypothetical protein